MNIEQELKSLEEEIAECKSELSKAEGSIETLMKRLKDEEDIDTLDEAEAALKDLEKDIARLGSDIKSKIESLRTIYEW